METQQASCKTILLIDDEDYILQIVEACIENFSNWRPALAASGDEGLAAAAKAKPDAILLDMMMPNMDGFTFLKNLKADPQLADIPVVLITARLDLLETQKNFPNWVSKARSLNHFMQLSSSIKLPRF